MKIALLCMTVSLFATLHASANDASHLPAKKRFSWTYRSGKGESTISLGKMRRIMIWNQKRLYDAYPLKGWNERVAYIVPTASGAMIVARRQIGEGGAPINVPVADLRWKGQKSWSFETGSGCILMKVLCSRSTDFVIVPGGKFDCVRIQVGSMTFWLAEGIGIVKMTRRSGKSKEVMELVRYNLS